MIEGGRAERYWCHHLHHNRGSTLAHEFRRVPLLRERVRRETDRRASWSRLEPAWEQQFLPTDASALITILIRLKEFGVLLL